MLAGGLVLAGDQHPADAAKNGSTGRSGGVCADHYQYSLLDPAMQWPGDPGAGASTGAMCVLKPPTALTRGLTANLIARRLGSQPHFIYLWTAKSAVC